MIRTVWLAAFCLASLGGLCASKVTASIYPSEESVPDQSQIQPVIGGSIVADTLTKADAAEVAPASETTGSLPLESNDVVAEKLQTPRSKHLSATNAHLKTVMLPKRRPKIRVAKSSSQDNTAIDSRSCAQGEGFSGFLKSLAGSPSCG
jgi:hypothetical protein